MSLFEDVERRIDAAMRELFRSPASQGVEREMIEIQRGIVENALARVERLPRARKLFPYNHLAIRIALPAEERRAAYEAVFAPGAVQQDLLRALRAEGAELPADLVVDIELVANAEPELAAPGFLIRYGKQPPRNYETKPISEVVLTPSSGQPATFKRSRIHIGRLPDVQDAQMRTIRKNDLVLNDESVSRAHAHIRLEDGSVRLFDDGSSHGTSVWRDGRLLPVPKGPKGFALRSGDEIVLGQARVRFEI